MWSDLVDLAGRSDVYQVIGLDLDLVARRKEGVKAHDEVWVTLKKLGDPVYHTRGVDAVQIRQVLALKNMPSHNYTHPGDHSQ